MGMLKVNTTRQWTLTDPNTLGPELIQIKYFNVQWTLTNLNPKIDKIHSYFDVH